MRSDNRTVKARGDALLAVALLAIPKAAKAAEIKARLASRKRARRRNALRMV